MKTVVAIAAFSVMALGLATAEAQSAKYVDVQGITHYVGSVDQVPAQYRATATTQSSNRRPIGTGGSDPAAYSDPAREAKETHEEVPADDP